MQLFYEPNFDSSATRFSINAMESRHISKVLRKAIGEEIYVTNGLGICAEGILISNHPKECKVEVKTIIEEKKLISDFILLLHRLKPMTGLNGF